MNCGDRYDFLIVGAGLYGASAARELTDHGFRVLVVERRDHIAGNAYTYQEDGITVHAYGPHIFHTDNERVWEFVSRFAQFNDFVNEPLASYKGELFSLPFNMNTFREMWGVTGPDEARKIIESQAEAAGFAAGRGAAHGPADLEEQAISLVGTDIYEKLIKGYTEKQWGRPCTELPASIIRRIPIRYEYNNNYYDDRYQGIPVGGYTGMVSRMLDGIDVLTGADFLDDKVRQQLSDAADTIIYSGQIDEYYGYCYGPLAYRGLRFETEKVELGMNQGGGWFQPRAVINYTDRETPWTRIIEHAHFEESSGCADSDPGKITLITREYPAEWHPGDEAFYPVNDEASMAIYEQYARLALEDKKVLFGGRLGSYRYYDMDDVIAAALELADELTGK